MEHLLRCIQLASEVVGLPSQAPAPLLSNHQLTSLHSAPITEPYLPSHVTVPPPSNPQPSQLRLLCSAPIMEPYSSSRISWVSAAPYDTTNTHLGHPAPTPITTRAISATQPFLGFNTLSVDMTVQVNQHRLALATATLPRQPHLVSHSGGCGNQCCGPAIHPPSLPHGPSISNCIYITPDSNGANMQMIWVRAMIYPPLPPTNSRVSHPNLFFLINGLERPWIYSLPSHVGRGQGISWMLQINSPLQNTNQLTYPCTHSQHYSGSWNLQSKVHFYANTQKSILTGWWKSCFGFAWHGQLRSLTTKHWSGISVSSIYHPTNGLASNCK